MVVERTGETSRVWVAITFAPWTKLHNERLYHLDFICSLMKITINTLRKIIKEEYKRIRAMTESRTFQVGQELTHEQVQQAFPEAWNAINEKLEGDGTSLDEQQGIFVVEPLEKLGGTYDLAEEPNAEVVPGGALCYHDDNFALAWLGQGYWGSIG